MKKFKIRKDDVVVVTSGKYKPNNGSFTTGRVLKVIKESDRVLIEGVNMVTRQMKPSAASQGGTVKKEASLHISNVALWDKDNNCPIRVGWKLDENGKKLRYNKKTGAFID